MFLRLNSEPLAILALSCLPVLAGLFVSNYQRGSLFLLTFDRVYRCWARDKWCFSTERPNVNIFSYLPFMDPAGLCVGCHGRHKACCVATLCVLLSAALIVLQRRRRHLIHCLSCVVSLENSSQGDNYLYICHYQLAKHTACN